MNRMFLFLTRPMSSVASNLKNVNDKIKIAASKRPQHLKQFADPRLVAVTKTKGIEVIFDAYDAGQQHFGENYVKELHEKANDLELLDRCEDIRWHFIGHLQRNKVGKVLDVPNLYMVETVDSEKIAKALNEGWGRLKKSDPLKVMAQCNTSGEQNKNGCPPDKMVQLAKFITECENLRLVGLMTIGAFDFDYSKGQNPDFESLTSIRDEVCNSLRIPSQEMELSMGMSADFEHAILAGSTNVRVGSTLFGARTYPQRNTSAAKTVAANDEATEDTSQDSTVKDVTQEMQKTAIS